MSSELKQKDRDVTGGEEGPTDIEGRTLVRLGQSWSNTGE